MRIKGFVLNKPMERSTFHSEPHLIARLCAWAVLVSLTTTFVYQLSTGFGLMDPRRPDPSASAISYANLLSGLEDDEAHQQLPPAPEFSQLDFETP
jgi:hypothetical protein